MEINAYTARGYTLADLVNSKAEVAKARAGALAAAGSAMLGLSTGRLARLYIRHEKGKRGRFDGRIEALFNPSRVTVTGGVGWRLKQSGDARQWSAELEVGPGDYQPVTLSMDLLFDTSEGSDSLWSRLGDAVSGGALQRVQRPSGTSVLTHTRRILKLAQPDQELHEPPICELWWGAYKLMTGVLTHTSQEFTHWLPDGTPVRARVNCSFTENVRKSPFELHSPDVEKTHVVRAGDSLPAIAAAYYDDPAQWRAVARFNGIDDPRALSPGRVLRIPALEGA